MTLYRAHPFRMDEQSDALLVRSVGADGESAASPANPVTIQFPHGNLTPFNDLIAVPLSPRVQVDFVYGINSQQGAVTINTTGVGDSDSGRLRLQTGTGSAGSATYKTRRSAQYRPGQGMVARLTFLMSTPVANSAQYGGVGDENNGYFFGANGAAVGILHRNAGSDTWVEQASWNGDTCNGTGASGFNWDVTKGTPMMIAYPYLGYGNINFFLQDSENSRWILCHTIKYANTATVPQVRNPDMGVYAKVGNSGNTSNLIAYMGSAAIFLCGEVSLTGKPKWASDSTKSSVSTEVNLLTIKNATTYNGTPNKGLIRVNSVSFTATAVSGTQILRAKISATLGGSPSYSTINGTTGDGGATITSGNSLASVDKAGTTITNGTYIFAMGPGVLDVRELEIYVAPGETLTFSGESSLSTTETVAVNWTEDI